MLGFLRLLFLSPWRFLSRTRASLSARRRWAQRSCVAADAAGRGCPHAATASTNLRKHSARFLSRYRVVLLEITTSPDGEKKGNRFCGGAVGSRVFAISVSKTVLGIQRPRAAYQRAAGSRTTALVSVVFTCWPPAPELRAYDTSKCLAIFCTSSFSVAGCCCCCCCCCSTRLHVEKRLTTRLQACIVCLCPPVSCRPRCLPGGVFPPDLCLHHLFARSIAQTQHRRCRARVPREPPVSVAPALSGVLAAFLAMPVATGQRLQAPAAVTATAAAAAATRPLTSRFGLHKTLADGWSLSGALGRYSVPAWHKMSPSASPRSLCRRQCACCSQQQIRHSLRQR